MLTGHEGSPATTTSRQVCLPTDASSTRRSGVRPDRERGGRERERERERRCGSSGPSACGLGAAGSASSSGRASTSAAWGAAAIDIDTQLRPAAAQGPAPASSSRNSPKTKARQGVSAFRVRSGACTRRSQEKCGSSTGRPSSTRRRRYQTCDEDVASRPRHPHRVDARIMWRRRQF